MDARSMATALGLDEARWASLRPGRFLGFDATLGATREAALRDLFCAACVSHGGWREAGDWLSGRSPEDLASPLETIGTDEGLFDLLGIVLDDAFVRAAVIEALP